MNETVSVDEAIAKGHRMANYPVMIIIIGILGPCIYIGIQKNIAFWIIPAGFGLAFGSAWLYWSFMITKWRLWAFENVRNVHELKKRAIKEKLIWADNSIFEKTEIRGSKNRERWNSLQTKFDKDDLFIDDITIPDETIIYYSKVKNYSEMVIMLGCLTFGIYLIIARGNYLVGAFLSVIGAYFGYKELKEATNIEPQIIINDKGIKTSSTEFYHWTEIENAEAISEGSGKHIKSYLVYDHPKGSEHLQIDDLNTDLRILNKLLIIYNRRNKIKNNYL